jgi:hypothetical protein
MYYEKYGWPIKKWIAKKQSGCHEKNSYPYLENSGYPGNPPTKLPT